MAKKMKILRDGCGNPVKVVPVNDKVLRCGMVFTTDCGLRMTIANYDDTSGLWLCEIPGQDYTRYYDEYTIKKFLGWRK